ncbi:hypothetical protein ACFT7S_03900 [Streptomyces sp. NPDC057136]|uniref:hypothetical protein n=1 Tax=Streptomyces sp. NPDC057136 TaxID=3346029 RepID=UPI0036417524
MNHGSENTPDAHSDTPADGAGDRGQAQGRAPEPEPERELEPELEPEPDPHGVQARGTVADGDCASADTSVLTSLFGARPSTGTGTGSGSGDSGAALDELALRRMLQGVVQDLEPSDGTLDHLHRAVPARRARRRQAVVGVAAAALLIGTAVPAFVHVASSDGDTGVNSAIAGHGEQAQGGSGEEPGEEPGDDKEPGPADEVTDGGKGEADISASPSADGGDVPDPKGIGGVADTPRSETAAMPSCGSGQLRVVSAESGDVDADGKVYGTFRISNVSGEGCSVGGDGSVGVQAMGAADPLKVQVVQHIAGDPADGLPDPSLEPGTVMLKPAMEYEVRFAWVPSDTCPTTGASPSPTPTDGVGGSTGEGATPTDTEAQFGSEDGGTADGSIAVTHTPEPGSPTAQTTISNACAGTIYRTGALTVPQ